MFECFTTQNNLVKPDICSTINNIRDIEFERSKFNNKINISTDMSFNPGVYEAIFIETDEEENYGECRFRMLVKCRYLVNITVHIIQKISSL